MTRLSAGHPFAHAFTHPFTKREHEAPEKMPLKRADLHLHTRFSDWKRLRVINPRDSYTDPLVAYEQCRRAGMDFVAFTDHDTIDGALDLLSRRPELEPVVIVGEEVETGFPDTGQWIHVNVFDIDEATHREIQRLKRDVHDLVGFLRRQRIFHVLNHPFQSYRLQQPALDYVDRLLDLFDFFEVGNGTQSARHNRAVAEMLDYAALAGRPRKGGVGGSDAHNVHNIATCCTEVTFDAGAPAGNPSGKPPGKPLGKKEWLAAVSRGEGRAVGRSIGALGLTANVYRIIGQYYRSRADPEMRRRMSAINVAAAAALAPVCVLGLPAFLNLGNSLRLEAVTAHVRRQIERRTREMAAETSPVLAREPLD